VFLDFADTVLPVAEPFSGILAAQLLNESLGTLPDLLWKFYDIDSLKDYVVRLHRIGSSERRTERVQRTLDRFKKKFFF